MLEPKKIGAMTHAERANRLRLDLVESPANTAYFLEQVELALRQVESETLGRAQTAILEAENGLSKYAYVSLLGSLTGCRGTV
jgi:hypothetical protein